ncbi:MAG: hypothetical protein RLZZ502_438, partial [Pseudomonadota bacterium]
MEFELTPINNKALTNLCGPLDDNLRQIETALDVRILRRAAYFVISGENEDKAGRAIQKFYLQAQQRA